MLEKATIATNKIVKVFLSGAQKEKRPPENEREGPPF